MFAFEHLLVCPVCHGALPLAQMRQTGEGCCDACGYKFTYSNGIFHFAPNPPPTADVAAVWHIWEDLQKNGAIAYEKDPEHNLSWGEREDAKAFLQFCRLTGLTLDIGCGPQRGLPSYASTSGIAYVGLDPLTGYQPKAFSFVQGIAEYLPFRSASFDHILFATSLDHMLNPQRTLIETKRVVRSTGTVNIWIFDSTQKQNALMIAQKKVKFALSLVQQGNIRELTRRLIGKRSPHTTTEQIFPVASEQSPEYLSAMTIPEGAIDQFHFFHPTLTDVINWLQEAGLKVVKVKSFKTHHLFLQAQR